MQQFGPEPERFVLCSERIALLCECGEKLILLGQVEDWRSRDATFECGCGEMLTLADQVDEELLGVEELLDSLGSPGARRPGNRPASRSLRPG